MNDEEERWRVAVLTAKAARELAEWDRRICGSLPTDRKEP